MASVYSKRKILYISWFDWSLNKTKNRSTRLADTPENRRKAQNIAKELQNELDKKKDEFEKAGILKGSTIGGAFDHFLRNNANKHKKTRNEYNMFFQLFSQRFNRDSPCTIINKLDIEAWLISVRDGLNKAQNTKHIYYKQCRHFLNFLFEYSYIPMFMINSSVQIRPERKEIITFRRDEIDKIFNNLGKKNSNFTTFIWMAYYTGLRPSSLITIKAEMIDLEQMLYHYWDAKRKKWIENPFHFDLLPILKKRIAEVKTGEIIQYKDATAVSKAFRKYLRKIGLYSPGVNSKTFRKTFISRASATMELSAVSKLVGHENITTTDRYYNKVDLERQRKELHKLDITRGAE